MSGESKAVRNWRQWRNMLVSPPVVVGAAEEMAQRIDLLILEYLQAHPDYQFPPKARHPAILAMAGPISHWLIQRLGGLVPWLNAVVEAGEAWFTPGYDEFALKMFCYFFEGSASIGWGNRLDCQEVSSRYDRWRRTVRFKPQRTTPLDELKEAQSRTCNADFDHLLEMCSRRIAFARHAPLIADQSDDVEDDEERGCIA